MMLGAAAWSKWDNLNASTRQGVLAAARCDRDLYHDAIRRMGLDPSATLNNRLNESLCGAALYMRPQETAAHSRVSATSVPI